MFFSMTFFFLLAACLLLFFYLTPMKKDMDFSALNMDFTETPYFDTGVSGEFGRIYDMVYAPERYRDTGITGSYQNVNNTTIFVPDNRIYYLSLESNLLFIGYQEIGSERYYFTNVNVKSDTSVEEMDKLMDSFSASLSSHEVYVQYSGENNHYALNQLGGFDLYSRTRHYSDTWWNSLFFTPYYPEYLFPGTPRVTLCAYYTGSMDYYDVITLSYNNFTYAKLNMWIMLIGSFVSLAMGIAFLIACVLSRKTVPLGRQLQMVAVVPKLEVKIVWALVLAFLLGISFDVIQNAFLIALPVSAALLAFTLFTWILELSAGGFASFFKNSYIYKLFFFIGKHFNKEPIIHRFSIIYWVITFSCMVIGGLVVLYTSYWFLTLIYLFFCGIAVLVYTLVLRYLNNFNLVIKGAEIIASGKLDHTIDTYFMRGALLSHANTINSIKDVLHDAIENEVKSQKSKTELITNVSHDLKTPLTSIVNYVDLLSKENLQPDYANDYVKIIKQKSQRLKDLISDLFEAAKASSGDIKLNIEKLDLCGLLNQALAESSQKIFDSQLLFKVSIPPEEKVIISADGSKMWRIFDNLINNALKYSMPHTRVYIDMVADEDIVTVSFKNVSAFELNFDPQEIIERFKRGDEARSTEGSGLGLAIAKNLVELMGGSLQIFIDGDLFKACINMPVSEIIHSSPAIKHEAALDNEKDSSLPLAEKE